MKFLVTIVSALLILAFNGHTSHAQTTFNVWFHNNSSVTNFVARPHPGAAIVTLGQAPDPSVASTVKAAGYTIMEGIGGGSAELIQNYIGNTWTPGEQQYVENTINQIAADMRQSNGTYSGYIYVDEPVPAPTSIDPSQNLCSAASIHYNVTGYNMIYNYIHMNFPGIKFGLTVGYDAVANGGCGTNSTTYGPAYIHLSMLQAGLREDFSSEEEYNACCSNTNPFIADGQKARFPNVLTMALLYSTSALCQSNGAYPGPAAGSGFDIIGAWDVDLYGGWIGPLMDQSLLPNLETYAATGQPTSFCEAPTSRISPGDWTWNIQKADFTVTVNDFYFQNVPTPTRQIATCQYAVMAGAGAINGPTDPSMVTTVPWTNWTCNANLTITVGSMGMCNVNNLTAIGPTTANSNSQFNCLVFTRALDKNGVSGNVTYQEYMVNAPASSPPPPPPRPASVAHVQGKNSTDGIGKAVSLPAAVKNGDAVVVSVLITSETAVQSITVTDNKNNTYAQEYNTGLLFGSAQLATFYSSNITNGPQTINVKFSGTPSFVWTTIDEFSGVAAVDQSGYNNQVSPGTGTNAVTSPAEKTTVAGELIYGVTLNASDASGVTAGTDFTQALANFTEYKVQRADGPVAVTWTELAAANGRAARVNGILTLKP